MGRVYFTDTYANIRQALRVDEVYADAIGGYARITATNDGECAPGASVQQRFLFRWVFSSDVSLLTFPQQFDVRFTIEADSDVPCLDLNPFMSLRSDTARLQHSTSERYYWRPNPPHVSAARTVRVTTGDAWSNPVFFSVVIEGFRGHRGGSLTTTYPYTQTNVSTAAVAGDRPTQDMIARARRDPRFGPPIGGSLGARLDWASAWELRWLDFTFSEGRRVRVYHATSKSNSAVRYTIHWDPDRGQWGNWQPA